MALNIYAETNMLNLKNKKIMEGKTMFPKIKDVEANLKAIKKCEFDPDIKELDITLAWKDKETGANKWTIQIGDNSFIGSAYFYEYWAVGILTRRSNCRDLARDLIRDIQDLYYQ